MTSQSRDRFPVPDIFFVCYGYKMNRTLLPSSKARDMANNFVKHNSVLDKKNAGIFTLRQGSHFG